MDISIVGSGYVGLITAVGLASKGHNLVCIDVDKERVNSINRAEPPFFEEGLSEALRTHAGEEGNLRATLDYEEILGTQATFICVTTCSSSGKSADFRHVKQSTRTIGEVLRAKKDYHVVVTKSSVVPGTTEELVIPLLEETSQKSAGDGFGAGVNPEFLQESEALRCFLNSDRIVIGQFDRKSGDVMSDIYQDFAAPCLRMAIRTAEMIKFASNAFLATKISFINEVGNLCKQLGIDVYEVADGMGYDPRIGRSFLNAGIGFGGSCLPKDLEVLLHRFASLGESAPLLQGVMDVNTAQPLRLVELVRARLGDLKGKTLAVLGLAFKPGTDDLRNAPAVKIIRQLIQQGARVKAYDPRVMAKISEIFNGSLQCGQNVAETIAGSDAVLLLTEWDEFRDVTLYAGKTVIDGRRVLDPTEALRVCHSYEGVCW